MKQQDTRLKRKKRLCNGKEKAQIGINNLSLFQRLSSVALITKGNLCLITSGLERVRGRGQRLEVLAVGLLCLFRNKSEKHTASRDREGEMECELT